MKKIMKNLKRIPALMMLVLSLVMTVPTNVFAIESTDKGTATVNIEIDEKYAGMTVSAYRIIDVNIDDNAKQPAQPVYTWRSELNDFISGYENGKFVDEENSIKDANGNITNYAVSKDFCKEGSDDCALTDGEIKKFYDAVANAIRDGGLISDPVTVDGAAGDISMQLGMGNYVVLIEKGVNIYSPSAVNVVPVFNETNNTWEVKVEGKDNDAKIKPKYTTPSIEKTVEDDEALGEEIGKVHNYKIEVTIPQYPDNAINKKIYISDKFSEGLTLDETSIKVTVDGTQLTRNTDYNLDFGATLDGEEKTFVVSFTNAQYESALTETNAAGETVIKQTLTVEYKGIINENAVVGTTETNKAELKYSNAPYDTDGYNTPDPEVVEVYTYGIKITKTDDEDEPIEFTEEEKRAVFSVSATKGGTPIEFHKTADGVYRKAVLNDITDANGTVLVEADTDKTTELIVSAEGTLTINGLAEGEYWVTETKAPEGFIKLQNPVKITVKDADTPAELDGKVTDEENDNNDGYADKTIPNSNHMPVLPITGGIGTLLFSVIGIIFMGLGAFLIKNILKKEDVQ